MNLGARLFGILDTIYSIWHWHCHDGCRCWVQNVFGKSNVFNDIVVKVYVNGINLHSCLSICISFEGIVISEVKMKDVAYTALRVHALMTSHSLMAHLCPSFWLTITA